MIEPKLHIRLNPEDAKAVKVAFIRLGLGDGDKAAQAVRIVDAVDDARRPKMVDL
jgi:hypothetical protein